MNSGKNVYQVTPEAFAALTAFGTDNWPGRAQNYRDEVGSFVERWAMERSLQRIAVTLPNGEKISLSPGGQNSVIVAVIEEFGARYTPGGQVLYIGDADDKWVVREVAALAELGIVVNDHGKMPDVVIYDVARRWLVIVEAVTSHGPMDAKRVDELNRLFAGSAAGLVFVTAFPNRATFKRWAGDLSWETEVWLADEPSHMIHFNGNRYLGPYARVESDFRWSE